MAPFTLLYRASLSKWFGLTLLVVLVVGEGAWSLAGPWAMVRESAAFLCIAAAVMGRMWASVYISGHKNRRLVTEGPYSVVRNPLYLFSLAGATGVGLAAESLLVLTVILLAFVLLYAFTISAEEAQLALMFGADYERYRARTPRIVPRWSNYRRAETQPVSPRDYTRALVDTMWFFWAYGAVQGLGALHAAGALPAFIRLP